MKINKKVSIRVIKIGVIPFLIFLYFISYGIILPLTDNSSLSSLAYILYSPIEQLRNHSKSVNFLTEEEYLFFGGKVHPKNRYAFENAIRRSVTWRGGKLCSDELFKNGNLLTGIIYYPNGGKLLESKNKSIKEWHKNGQLKYYEDFNKEFIRQFDTNGNLLSECTTINHKPWNGTIIVLQQDHSLVLQKVMDGQRVNIEHNFDLQNKYGVSNLFLWNDF